ncbi:hypothetical protein MesoLj131a_62700 [Mesorhizobium sp. 131-2-1]|nr:hypothetical protein MesoLj131a_62700 [Mesorhizobium sp. 131-2-1]BCH04477.1 hypothetical protein MesoLj131b_64760 [Mesorhizobium sp. 131-2-5]
MVVRPAPANSVIASTRSTPGRRINTKESGADKQFHIAGRVPDRRFAHENDPAAYSHDGEDWIVLGTGKRIALGPTAVKPPVISISARVSLRMSENGLFAFSYSRKLCGFVAFTVRPAIHIFTLHVFRRVIP